MVDVANQLVMSVVEACLQAPRHGRSWVAHLTQGLRDAILDGRLGAGVPLPSTRALAVATPLGRSTWVGVFEQLTLEGYLVSQQGAPTRVGAVSVTPRAEPPSTAPPAPRAVPPSPRWRLDDPPSPIGTEAFRPGLPELQAFPAREWAARVARRCRAPALDDLGYAQTSGTPALREALLQHLRQTRGVRAQPEQLLVLPSAQAAFAVVADACLTSGDVAWVEDPGYPGIRSVLRSRGATVVAQPVDAAGLTLDHEGAPPRLIYVTPSHQLPTGVTMPLPRRLALLEWAARWDALVIEDDYDSEYQYHGRPVPSLQGLDRHDCVVYVGTFSKTLAPGLRIAYLIAPPRWRARLEAVAWINGYGVPVPWQNAMADMLADGGLQRHLRHAVARANARLLRLTDCLRAAGDARLLIPEPAGGLQLCVGWQGQTPDTLVAERLRHQGLHIQALSAWCHTSKRQGFVLGIGLVPMHSVAEAAQRFLTTVRACP